MGAGYTAGLQQPVASFLQQVAHQTVFDSLSTWNIGDFDPLAAFSTQSNGLAVQFNHTGNNCSQFNWDFGDGQSAIGPSPQHTYGQGGAYAVTLIAGNGCSDDTTTQLINLSATGIPDSDPLTCVERIGETFRFQCAVKGLDLFALDGRVLDQVRFLPGTSSYTIPSSMQSAMLVVFTLEDGRQFAYKSPVIR